MAWAWWNRRRKGAREGESQGLDPVAAMASTRVVRMRSLRTRTEIRDALANIRVAGMCLTHENKWSTHREDGVPLTRPGWESETVHGPMLLLFFFFFFSFTRGKERCVSNSTPPPTPRLALVQETGWKGKALPGRVMSFCRPPPPLSGSLK